MTMFSLEVAQKFVVRSQSLYGVERDFRVSFGPRPKLNRIKSFKMKNIQFKEEVKEEKALTAQEKVPYLDVKMIPHQTSPSMKTMAFQLNIF